MKIVIRWGGIKEVRSHDFQQFRHAQKWKRTEYSRDTGFFYATIPSIYHMSDNWVL